MSIYGNPVMLGGSGGGGDHKIYGFHIDSTNSDPESCVTYLMDAVGMTPARMNYSTGSFDYGSWGSAFFLPKPCMLNFNGTVAYYLDPDDYSKKADGTASDVASLSFGGNAMMEWGQNGKKIWYKIVPDSTPTSASVYISDYMADNDYRAWSFINSQGDFIDHFYTPIYDGHLDSSNRMRSISGQAVSSAFTPTEERTYCRNNSSLAIWDTEVYCDIILINLLLVLISKSLDSQTAFGQGATLNGTQTIFNDYRTGAQNARGLFYGTNSGEASVSANSVKVFGMENWWGVMWRRFAGLVDDHGTLKYKLTRSSVDGSTASDYVISDTSADYNGYLVGGTVPQYSWSLLKKQRFRKWSYEISEADESVSPGNMTTYYCDACLTAASNVIGYPIRGGAMAEGLRCGAFAAAIHNGPAAAWYSFGACPSCKPLS